MKKKIFIICTAFLLTLPIIIHGQDIENSDIIDTTSSKDEFHGKIGTAYASKPGKFGLDLSFQYFKALDPWFAFGGEFDFFWISWNRKLGEEEIGLTTGDVKAETDAYVFPLLFNVQVRIPPVEKIINIEPMLTVGLGYAFMIVDESVPAYTKSGGGSVNASDNVDLYHGFTWQVVGGFSYQPEGSNIYFILDFGYRGAGLEKDNIELDMSGFLGRVGVKMNI